MTSFDTHIPCHSYGVFLGDFIALYYPTHRQACSFGGGGGLNPLNELPSIM